MLVHIQIGLNSKFVKMSSGKLALRLIALTQEGRGPRG